MMKDEQGRPFIIVKEYVNLCVGRALEDRTLTWVQSRKEEETTWQRCCQIPHSCSTNRCKYRTDIISMWKIYREEDRDGDALNMHSIRGQED